MPRFERITLSPADWGKALSDFDDRIVFQTPQWQAFLVETQRGEPVLAALKEGDETLGYFEPRPWHEDRPQRPKVWPAETWRAQWGFGSFGTFPGYP